MASCRVLFELLTPSVPSLVGAAQVMWLYGEDAEITEVGTMNLFILFTNASGAVHVLLKLFPRIRVSRNYKRAILHSSYPSFPSLVADR